MSNELEKMSINCYKVLDYILSNPDCCPGDMFFDFPTIDGIVEILCEYGYVTDENGILGITELGRNALVEYSLALKEKKNSDRFKVIQFVIPTAISMVALAVSIISLILQFQG